MSVFDDVKMFADACDQFPSEEMVKLYHKLIVEEKDEFDEAVDENDDLEQLDACMDMIWVIVGYGLMKGWDMNGAWQELTENNMSKIDAITGKVIRREDGKILKPDSWSPPAFSPFL